MPQNCQRLWASESGLHSAVSRVSDSRARGPRFSPSADSRRTVVSYWLKYVHLVLVNHLGGLSLPKKSVVRLNDRPDMTISV